MIALVPVSRFKVTYDIASGRPYSRFEHLVLEAVDQGHNTVAALGALFAVHPRLITEAVVTLIRAGWISFGADAGEWSLTLEGKRAIASGEPPTSLSVASAKPVYVLLERVTGAVIPANDVRFYTRTDLAAVWRQSIRVPAQVNDNDLDVAAVQHLLPRGLGEWVPWIGPIDMISKNNHWLVVEVDPDTGVIRGLPMSLRDRLAAVLMHSAQTASADIDVQLRGSTLPAWHPDPAEVRRYQEVPHTLPDTWHVAADHQAFIVGSTQHEAALARALSGAETYVFIASAFLAQGALEAIKGAIGSALARGVEVDLLWGYSGERPDAVADSLRLLGKLVYEGRRADVPGSLHFNSAPSGSHAKFVLWDEADSQYAAIGSYNWLSASRGSNVLEVSTQLSHPGVIGALCREIAGLWGRVESEITSSVPDRWQRRAAEMEAELVRASARDSETDHALCRVRLLRDRAHEASLRNALVNAHRRLLVLSHRLGPAAMQRLEAGEGRERSDDFDCTVAYGETTLELDEMQRANAMVGGLPGSLRRLIDLHAKVLISDSRVIIGSYNFLAADPFGTARASRELSVEITGEEQVSALVTVLAKELEARQT